MALEPQTMEELTVFVETEWKKAAEMLGILGSDADALWEKAFDFGKIVAASEMLNLLIELPPADAAETMLARLREQIPVREAP
jgi:hypothetical protein